MAYRIRVWDLPTRIFHWTLALCIVGLVITGNIGGLTMDWHQKLGCTVLSLLLFRLVWGFVGGRWSRFASFVQSPSTVLDYLKGRGRPEHLVGHNPLGAGSVLAMLLFLLLQVLTGSFSDDTISFSGPMSKFVSDDSVRWITHYHKHFGKTIVFALILLHLGAIGFYAVRKKQNLVVPMINGDKELEHHVEASRDDARTRTMAAVIFVLCCVLVFGGVQLAG